MIFKSTSFLIHIISIFIVNPGNVKFEFMFLGLIDRLISFFPRSCVKIKFKRASFY
jgi:hypothetical protein